MISILYSAICYNCSTVVTMPYISLKEVEEHNSSDKKSSWIVLYGRVYDITSFINLHPGGDIIQFATGIADATCLFESYHSKNSIKKCQTLLMKHGKYLGELSTETELSYNYAMDIEYTNKMSKEPDSPDFFYTVRDRVDTYIQENYSGRHALHWIYQIEAFVTLFLYCLLSYYRSFQGSYLATVILGLIIARMGFLMHSGNHCAISTKPYWNRFVGYFMDIIGSSHYTWIYEHQIAHHMTPNEYHKDNDCEIGQPFFRFHPLIPSVEKMKNDKVNVSRFRTFIRRYQHILVPTLMGVGFFKWTINDMEFILKSKGGNVRLATKFRIMILTCLSKILWLTLHIIIPYINFGAKFTIISLIIFMAIGAYYLENIFIVNHIQEKLQLPMTNSRDQRSSHWARQQVYTSANWKSGSQLATFLSGGLNHQVEHHLFPSMNIYLYPIIAPIVEEECNKFGLPYHNYMSFQSAWIDMFYYLKKLGNDDKSLDHLQ